jgi:hypothetical protein
MENEKVEPVTLSNESVSKPRSIKYQDSDFVVILDEF